jgi:integrase
VTTSGAVIEYQGKRGTVWRIKFADANGRQVMQTLGPTSEGWTRKKAERALGAKLAEVARTRWRKPDRLTFAAFAERFESEALPGRGLKPTTLSDYKAILRGHLVPFFDEQELATIEAEDVDRYVSTQTGTLAPKTIGNHLRLLGLMFKTARRWRLVAANPVEDVDAPRVESGEMSVLTEVEIARLLTAYQQLEADPPEGTTAAEWRQARRVVVVALGSGLRRGELLALRWRDVQLLEGVLSVRQSFVRGTFQTPKSHKGRRTFKLGAVTVAALNEQYEETRYRGDTDLVFCHRELGSPLDPSKLSRVYLRPAITKAAIEKPFRVFHDLRHTSITMDAASGNPQAYIQMKAGHSSSGITERYVHAAAVLFPGAADKAEARLFGSVEVESSVES